MRDYAHRKAARRLQVTDASGNPVRNTVLEIKQTGHSFLFGCGAFDTIPYTNDRKDDPFCKDRVEKWLNLYNYGTLPFYWGRYEPTEGKPAFESTMNAASFLTGKKVKVKGHPLCWHTVCADWLMEYDNKTILEAEQALYKRWGSDEIRVLGEV